MSEKLKALAPALCCAAGIIVGTEVAVRNAGNGIALLMIAPLLFAASLLGADMLVARVRDGLRPPSKTAVVLALTFLVALLVTALRDPGMVALMLPVLGGGIAVALLPSGMKQCAISSSTV